MGAGWAEAVFLGYQRSSNCYIVATERGVESTRSIYRQPMQQRWSPAAVARIKATPWTEREKHNLDVHFNEPPEAPGDPAPREAPYSAAKNADQQERPRDAWLHGELSAV